LEKHPTMTFHLPIIVHYTRLRDRDLGGRGRRRRGREAFRQKVLRYRDHLCVVEMYHILRTRAEMRRVQEMLYTFILQHGGRIVKPIPDRPGYFYVLSYHAAMEVISKMLYEGINVAVIDTALPLGTFPVDDDADADSNANHMEIYREFQNS
jgi:hypothetical protein